MFKRSPESPQSTPLGVGVLALSLPVFARNPSQSVDLVTAAARARRDLGVESRCAGGGMLRSTFAELAALLSPTKNLDFAFGQIRSRDNDDPKSTTQSLSAGLTLRFASPRPEQALV